jgi:hypothetical protein
MSEMLALTVLVAGFTDVHAAPLGVSDANGVLLGTFAASDNTGVQIVTLKGYTARILVYRDSLSSPPEGSLSAVFGVDSSWASSDCSGQRLAETPVAGRVESTSEAVYYVPAEALPVTIHSGQQYSYRGDYTGAVCQQGTMAQDKVFVPVYLNDPVVTGIGNGPFAVPLKLSFVDSIYRNGFESPV